MNFGIIGFGRIARKFVKAIEAADEGKIYAIGSRSVSMDDLYLKEHPEVKVYKDYEELLNDTDSSLGEYTFILYNEKEKTENTLSLEALIIDKMIKEEISLKEAINIIRQENNSLSKKDLYNAGLKLKDIFKWFWIDLLFLYQYRYERSFLNGKT